MREVERLKFPDMQLLLQIIGHFPPRILQARPNAKDPAYEELVIPERLRDFKVDFSSITGLLKPFAQAPLFASSLLVLQEGEGGLWLYPGYG